MTDVANFLATIPGTKKLCEITVPGSHDAGVYAEDAKSLKFAPKSSAICQSKNLCYQCMSGSRYFDIRIEKFGGTLKAHHTAPIPIKVGATGGELERMMAHLVAFVDSHTGEFVIARFSKSKGHAAIVAEVKRIADKKLFKGAANIARTKLDAVRGKIIAVFDDSFDALMDPVSGVHRFASLEGKGGRNNGLFTCGKYANSTKMVEVYKKAFMRLEEHDQHSTDDHLALTYMTQTGGNVKKNTLSGAHQQMKSALDDMRNRTPPMSEAAKRHWQGLEDVIDRKLERENGLPGFQAQQGSLALVKAARQRSGLAPVRLPNVMYDFVNDTSSEDIIALNFPAVRSGTV